MRGSLLGAPSEDIEPQLLDQTEQILCVLLLLREDFFHQASRGRIVVAQVPHDVAVAFDGDPLGDQILLA